MCKLPMPKLAQPAEAAVESSQAIASVKETDATINAASELSSSVQVLLLPEAKERIQPVVKRENDPDSAVSLYHLFLDVHLTSGCKVNENKHTEELEDEGPLETKDNDNDVDHEDLDLENLVDKDWKGQRPSAPLHRRQKRRQRQRANAKIGRALRRFVNRRGLKLAQYNQLLLDQTQRSIVGYLDFLFGPMNLPQDDYLNKTILDPVYKSAPVESILHFEGIQQALAAMGQLEHSLQLAVVVDSLRWSQSLRCGPICNPDGTIVYFVRVKPQQPMNTPVVDNQPRFAAGTPGIISAPAIVSVPFWLCVCGNCNQLTDARFGYCTYCGVFFE